MRMSGLERFSRISLEFVGWRYSMIEPTMVDAELVADCSTSVYKQSWLVREVCVGSSEVRVPAPTMAQL